MPCYQVNTISVELKAADRDLLEQALRTLGLSFHRTRDLVRVYAASGVIEITGDTASTTAQSLPTLNRIRQQYSREVIKAASTKYRWAASWKTPDRVTLRRY